MSRLAIAAVSVCLLGGAAYGGTPVVENGYMSVNPDDVPLTAPFDWTDVSASVKQVTLPSGTALITYSLISHALSSTFLRPVIGNVFPLDGTMMTNDAESGTSSRRMNSGSWVTQIEGGEVTVKLQVRQEGSAGSIFRPNGGSLSWSLVVFPDDPPSIPAIGNVGLGILIATLAAAGGWVISKRKGFGHS